MQLNAWSWIFLNYVTAINVTYSVFWNNMDTELDQRWQWQYFLKKFFLMKMVRLTASVAIM